MLIASAILAYVILATQKPVSEPIRVACVGDSLTQSSGYVYDLWQMLGKSGPFTIGNYTEYPEDNSKTASDGLHYAVGNFGAGGTLIARQSETPYVNSSMFQDALNFQPSITIIMLGTNDAQPGAHQYNASLVVDYEALINAFQTLSSKPDIWVVLPPPIFDSQGGKTSPEYFEETVIPAIKLAANEVDVPVINVHLAMTGLSNYFPDGIHPNSAGAEIIANEIFKAITS